MNTILESKKTELLKTQEYVKNQVSQLEKNLQQMYQNLIHLDGAIQAVDELITENNKIKEKEVKND